MLAGILLLYLAQQSILLQSRWVDDETWYLLPAQSLVNEGRMRISVFPGTEHEFVGTFPLLTGLQAASWKIHDLTVLQARLLSVALGGGVVLLAYGLGRRLFNE